MSPLLQDHPKVITSVDICSERLNRLGNSDFVKKKIQSLLPENVSSKFLNTGKIIPFVFGGENISIKMRSKASWHFRLANNSS